jgi:hypothetical protein
MATPCPQAVILISSSVSNEVDKVRQRKLSAALTSKKVRFREIDGMDPEHKETRAQLFDISGLRGKYPQVFIDNGDGAFTFVGDWDEFEGLLDADGLPPEVLAGPKCRMTPRIASRMHGCCRTRRSFTGAFGPRAAQVLKENPGIKTFSSVFAACISE